jgi:hypothetical protein
MRYIIVIGFSFIALCFQHIIHEYSHVLAAVILKEKVSHIQWLTYHGGTRVFYENEPDLSSRNIPKKWAVISGAGFITTTLLSYLFLLLYFIIENVWIKTGLCFFTIMFLIVDSLYFMLGSIFNFGDIIGVRKTLNISKLVSVVICTTIFLLHCAIAYFCFYQS